MSEDSSSGTAADTDNGGDGGDDTASSGQQQNASGKTAEFQAITSQEALDALVKDRVKRAERKGFQSAEERYKPGHDRAEALEHELSSDAEKQAKQAREEERNKARGEYTPRLVRQAFRTEAKGVLESDQLTALLEDLDLSRYVTDGGDVDEDKVAKKVAALAPKKDKDREFPDLGAGRRGGTAKNTSMSAFIRDRAGVNQ